MPEEVDGSLLPVSSSECGQFHHGSSSPKFFSAPSLGSTILGSIDLGLAIVLQDPFPNPVFLGHCTSEWNLSYLEHTQCCRIIPDVSSSYLFTTISLLSRGRDSYLGFLHIHLNLLDQVPLCLLRAIQMLAKLLMAALFSVLSPCVGNLVLNLTMH